MRLLLLDGLLAAATCPWLQRVVPLAEPLVGLAEGLAQGMPWGTCGADWQVRVQAGGRSVDTVVPHASDGSPLADAGVTGATVEAVFPTSPTASAPALVALELAAPGERFKAIVSVNQGEGPCDITALSVVAGEPSSEDVRAALEFAQALTSDCAVELEGSVEWVELLGGAHSSGLADGCRKLRRSLKLDTHMTDAPSVLGAVADPHGGTYVVLSNAYTSRFGHGARHQKWAAKVARGENHAVALLFYPLETKDLVDRFPGYGRGAPVCCEEQHEPASAAVLEAAAAAGTPAPCKHAPCDEDGTLADFELDAELSLLSLASLASLAVVLD